jgi:hypothetical protein
MSNPPLVHLDFNAMFDRNHVSLGTLGVKWDLDRQGVGLVEGLRLRGYDRDDDDQGKRNNFLCEGVVKRGNQRDEHYSKFDWVLAIDSEGHESDFWHDPGHWVHGVDWDLEERVRKEWRDQHPGSDVGITASRS